MGNMFSKTKPWREKPTLCSENALKNEGQE
jgi:hypothetical protein